MRPPCIVYRAASKNAAKIQVVGDNFDLPSEALACLEKEAKKPWPPGLPCLVMAQVGPPRKVLSQPPTPTPEPKPTKAEPTEAKVKPTTPTRPTRPATTPKPAKAEENEPASA